MLPPLYDRETSPRPEPDHRRGCDQVGCGRLRASPLLQRFRLPARGPRQCLARLGARDRAERRSGDQCRIGDLFVPMAVIYAPAGLLCHLPMRYGTVWDYRFHRDDSITPTCNSSERGLHVQTVEAPPPLAARLPATSTESRAADRGHAETWHRTRSRTPVDGARMRFDECPSMI